MGWFDFLKADPVARQGGAVTGGGMMFGQEGLDPNNTRIGLFGKNRAPLDKSQKLELLFAALRDTHAGFTGGRVPGGNLAQAQQGMSNQRGQAGMMEAAQRLQQAIASGDRAQIMQAAFAAKMAGVDVSGITDMMKGSEPRIVPAGATAIDETGKPLYTAPTKQPDWKDPEYQAWELKRRRTGPPRAGRGGGGDDDGPF